MKIQIKKLAIAALLSGSVAIVAAQVPPPVNSAPSLPGAPVAPPLNGPVLPGPGPRGPGAIPQNLQSLSTISGKVTGYQTNDRFAYNAFTLQTSSGSITVRFPDHLAQELMKAAKKGETISVKGFTVTGSDGITVFQLVTANAGSVVISDTPQIPPITPINPEPKSYSGNISNFQRDPQGNINGINLDNKVLVNLPPPAAGQLQSLLKTGDKIEVSGFKDTPPAGIVLAADAPMIIHPQTISLNGQTYLVR